MTTLKGRVGRLEYGTAPDKDDPFGLDGLTYEQLRIFDFDLAWHRLRDEETPDDKRADCARRIAKIESEIRQTAANWADPRYEAHRQRVLGMWTGARGAVGELVPPLFDGDIWWGWDRPKRIAGEMRWRRETRARPDIAVLIAEGEALVARQAETTARPGIAPAFVPAFVPVGPPPGPEPTIPSAAEHVASAPIPVAYPTTPEVPARGSFAVDYDPYREFRPR
jgi:hypothetical protein